VDQALASVQRVLRAFRAEGLSEEELSRVREYAAGSYALRGRSKDDVAAQLLEAEMFGQAPETVAQFGDRLRATSNEEIQDAARSLVDPERLIVVLAGTVERG
jgi:zinc protease